MVDVDVAAASAGSKVAPSTIHRWVRDKRLEPVSTRPIVVRLEDVIRVRDQCRAASVANLRKSPSES